MSLYKCCEVTTVHLLDPLEIRLTIIGNVLGTLFVYVQSTVCKKEATLALPGPLVKAQPELYVTKNKTENTQRVAVSFWNIYPI